MLEKKQKEEGKERIKLGTYVQEILWTVIEDDKILKESAPFLKVVDVGTDVMYIEDWKQPDARRIVSIRKSRAGYLRCDVDNSENCVHVGFAWAQPEVYRRMQIAGRKPPKIVKSKEEVR